MRSWAVVLVSLPLIATAETAYVTDSLRLGLHRAADTSDQAFRVLESGQKVEVLSRNRNYANVQLPDGAIGYVRATYLVATRPAKLIVAETQAENAKLAEQVEQLRQEFAAPAATIGFLEEQIGNLQADLKLRDTRIEALDQQNAELRRRQARIRHSLPFTWVAVAIGVCLIGGFMFGLRWVDYRSRRRHGGIRIY